MQSTNGLSAVTQAEGLNSNMESSYCRTAIFAGLMISVIGVCRADVTFNLTPNTLTVFPGGTAEFTGTVTNTGVANVFLNGETSMLSVNQGLILEDSPLFANAPSSLAALGGSYSGPLFRVIVDPNMVPGMYTGSFTLQGGTNSIILNNLASQTFQINVATLPVGSVPSSGNTCNGTFVGMFTGDLTVSNGQTCILSGGGATGNVTENGGNLVLTNAAIGGNLQVHGGTLRILPSSRIEGNLDVQNLPFGSAGDQVCGTSIKGNLTYQNNAAAVVIGAPSACLGNTIGGNFQLINNSASAIASNNTVNGDLQDQNNANSTQVIGNMVGGNLHVQNNTGPLTQVSSNKVANILDCHNNSTIIGAANTASKKQGQCTGF